jgi:hypothetical protein
MAAKLTTLTYKIAIQLRLVEENGTICSSCSRWQVRKVLDTSSYISMFFSHYLSYLRWPWVKYLNRISRKVKINVK